MQLLVCLLVLVMAAASPARAQSISGGFKGGLTVSDISTSGTGAFETDAENAAAVGGFVALELGSLVRLQPEVLVTSLRFSAPASGISVESRAIDVPILLHFRFAGQRRVRPIAFVGPRLGFVSNVTQSSGAGEADISDSVADLDAGLTFGAGLEAAAGRGALILEGRAALGLKGLSETGPPAIKSRAFLFLAGYRF